MNLSSQGKKKYLFPLLHVLADSCCCGVQGLKSEPEVIKVKILGNKVKNDLFSKFWLIRAPISFGGHKSEFEVNKVKT